MRISDWSSDVCSSDLAASDQKKSKIWLNVPYADKDDAKTAGARWDRQHKSWYAREGADMAAFSKWRSAAAPAAADSLSPTEEFAAFLQQHGVVLTGRPELAGPWHRAPLEDDKAGAKTASYRAFQYGRPKDHTHK